LAVKVMDCPGSIDGADGEIEPAENAGLIVTVTESPEEQADCAPALLLSVTKM
jgi:hypothetical protein